MNPLSANDDSWPFWARRCHDQREAQDGLPKHRQLGVPLWAGIPQCCSEAILGPPNLVSKIPHGPVINIAIVLGGPPFLGRLHEPGQAFYKLV